MYYKLAIGVALLALQIRWLKFPWFVAFGVTCFTYLASGGWRFVRLLWLTLPRDIRFVTHINLLLNGTLSLKSRVDARLYIYIVVACDIRS